MKIKTIGLAGHALDWAVAMCDAVGVEYVNDGITRCLLRTAPFAGRTGTYSPSSDWAQGGPIIEREIVCIDCEAGRKRWKAYAWRSDGDLQSAIGETPLIASMRCYVASKLGDEVEVPDELIA